MHIEMLWIIPIVSFVIFIGIVIFFAQQKSLHTELKQDVVRFNSGNIIHSGHHTPSETRLAELEKAISAVTDSINNQQNVIEDFKKEKIDCSFEINDLKDKLRELYKEYDIILSENYSLRAKLKKMIEEKNGDINSDEFSNFKLDHKDDKKSDSDDIEVTQGKVNLKLYEDTRLLNVARIEASIPKTKVNF